MAGESYGIYNIAFIGIAGSGKTHAIALFGITLDELEKKGEVRHNVDEYKLKLHELKERLRNGEVLPPTKPEDKTMGCVIHLSFPIWGGLRRKKVMITPLDTSGELLRVVMDLLPEATTIDDLIEKIKERTGITLTRKDVDDLRNFLLRASGYIMVIDAPVLLKRDSSRVDQNLGLVRFMQQLRKFRERADLPPLRGLAILLTKVDLIVDRVISNESDVGKLIQVWSPSLIPELNKVVERGGKIGYFYSWLGVEMDDKGIPYVKTIENMPEYSYNQYEKLTFWIRDTF